MKHSVIQKILCVALAACLLAGSTACGAAPDNIPAAGEAVTGTQAEAPPAAARATAAAKKTETVFVTLDSTGKPTQTIVTDWLHTETPGARVLDKTDLKNPVNIKGDETPQQDGASLAWDLTGSDLYYRGETQKPLPVELSVRYWLDGTEILPKDLAGKSGKVKIELTIQNNDRHTVTVNGNSVTMYTPLLAVAGMLLPDDVFQNIQVENGQIVADGSRQIALFTTVPGLEESLGLKDCGIKKLEDVSLPEAFTVTADVTGFKLGNIGVAVTADVPRLADLEGLSTLDGFKEKLLDLRDMQKQLTALDADGALRSLLTDPGKQEGAKVLAEDLNAFYQMDPSLLNAFKRAASPQNLEKAGAALADLQGSQALVLLHDPDLLRLAAQCNEQNLRAAQQLLEDAQTLEGVNLDQLAAVLGQLKETQALSGLLQSSADLADQAAENQKQLDALGSLLAVSGEAMDLLDEVQSMGTALAQQGISLDQSDLQIMVQALVDKKFAEKQSEAMAQAAQKLGMEPEILQTLYTVDAEAMVLPDGTVAGACRQAVLTCIGAAAQSGQLDAATAGALSAAVSAGVVPADQIPIVLQLISAVQSPIREQLDAQLGQAKQQKEQLTAALLEQLGGLLQKAGTLAGKVDAIGPDTMKASVEFAQALLPQLNELVGQLEKNKTQIEAVRRLLDDQQAMQALNGALPKLSSMQDTLKDPNLQGLTKQLLRTAQKPAVQTFLQSLPSLQRSADGASALLQAPETSTLLSAAPQTLNTLFHINDDLQDNRTVAEALRSLTSGNNLQTAGGLLEKLDELQEGAGWDSANQLLDDAGDLPDRLKEYVKLGENLRVFTDAPEDMETSLLFVLRTDAIQPPKNGQEAPPAAEPETNSFAKWLKDLFH